MEHVGGSKERGDGGHNLAAEKGQVRAITTNSLGNVIIVSILYNVQENLARVLYLANEPFERNWRILIWRLRRGYYSNDGCCVHRKTLIWRSTVKFARSPN